MTKKGGLGRGLGSLIPPKVAPQPGTEAAVVADAPEMEIPTDAIVANPHQPRKHFAPSDLDDLVTSIKEHGVLMPLLVTKKADGTYELIAGERRLRSARIVGLKTVPAVVRSATEQEKLELAIIENIQRADLNAVEEGRAYKSFADLFSLTQEQIAKRVGKSRSYVANTMRLLDLEEEILEAIVDGKITRSHARTLLSQGDEKKRLQLFKEMLKGGVTVREAEARTSVPAKKSKRDANVAAIEQELREALGTKVQLSTNGSTGKVTIHFYSKEELKALIKRLQG